jgi:hypothetical protein
MYRKCTESINSRFQWSQEVTESNQFVFSIGLQNREGAGLAEVTGFFPLLSFFGEAQDFIDDFHVRKKHTPATVPLNA